MSDTETNQAGTNGRKVQGGWGLCTFRYQIKKDIPGFPPKGTTVDIWQWGPDIWQIDSRAAKRHVITRKEVEGLEASGHLERIPRKGDPDYRRLMQRLAEASKRRELMLAEFQMEKDMIAADLRHKELADA